MKRIQFIILLMSIIFCTKINAQVAIGKDIITNNSVSLEFGDENRGLVLPYVNDKSKISERGTMIFDTTDYKVKYLKGSVWVDLTIDSTGIADLSIQNNKEEDTNASVFIGPNTTTDGILILDDHDRAMILPKVASPHLNIINPSAGMMVYDTTARHLAVYNGKVWTFWKP